MPSLPIRIFRLSLDGKGGLLINSSFFFGGKGGGNFTLDFSGSFLLAGGKIGFDSHW
ncbi:MAG: hypothetical protein IPP27_02460 [Bacteroidetes bacterium]|nr:hypothetical protein [Bacteroidota bacterium]